MNRNPEQRRRLAESLLGVCGGDADGARDALESAIGGVPQIRVGDDHARDAVFALKRAAADRRGEAARSESHRKSADARGESERAGRFRRKRDSEFAVADRYAKAAKSISAALGE